MDILKKNNKHSFSDILQPLSFNATMNLSDITELYNLMLKEKKLKEVFDLTRIKEREDDGRNYVYINRKQFIGKDYQDLINHLYDHFFGASTSTLESLFPDWMIWRRDHTKVTNKTLQENKFLWNAMFADTEIVKMPLLSLKAKDFIKILPGDHKRPSNHTKTFQRRQKYIE